METILEVKNLAKKFGTFEAVKGVSFAVPKGKIVGLLGPNGAGKTTTIHMLLGITTQTSGNVYYFGKEFEQNRVEILQKVGYVSAFNTLQGRISVWENLLVFARLFQVKDAKKKILDLIDYFEIKEILSKRYWDLSSGQKTRVNLIKAFINDLELVFMDEPTASLDPDIADKTVRFIEEKRRENNMSILYTSHDMEEVTRLCDEVIFLDHGEIFAQDTPLGLTKRIETAILNLTFDGDKGKVEEYLKVEKQDFSFPHQYSVTIKTKEKQIPKLIFGLSEKDIWITDIEVKKPTLEDVFLHIARGEKNVN
ncbi:MAG TPA: ABC transporter ATP-binding protein [Candidatus Saccharimonadales bacterium]|nr:ABC transporter ATP-binding protein [Candidatus Saccharimonadales bacterium]